MSRIAIIGSCITRDLWPILGETPQDLLYISRTSFATLFTPPPAGVMIADPPPAGLAPKPHAALTADLRKTALAALVAHRPTHIIFDFIDERFDLLSVGGGRVAHTWELEASGYLDQAVFADAGRISRLTPACDKLWTRGAEELSALLEATPLREAKLILHEAQWAQTYVDASGGALAFEPMVNLLEERLTDLGEQNALLERYQAAFVDLVPGLTRVRAPAALRVADAGHRWGLSPFHYVTDYYRDIWRQLREAGI